MADSTTTPTTTDASTTTVTPVADDMTNIVQKADNKLQYPVWHFVTVGGIALLVIGFCLGRLSVSKGSNV